MSFRRFFPVISACWVLISFPVLILHQVVATPEPLFFSLTASNYNYFGLSRYSLAYLALALASLSKASAVALTVYFLVQLLYDLRQTRSVQVLWTMATLVAISVVVLGLPYILMNHGDAAFDMNVVVTQIIGSNRTLVHESAL